MFFRNKHKEIISMLEDYIEKVDECFDNFSKSIELYLENNEPREEEFVSLVAKTHESESKADDLRHDFEKKIYDGNVLLPGSRSDVFTLIESFDALPNKAETILYIIQCENIQLPDDLRDDFHELAVKNADSYEQCKKTLMSFFTDLSEIGEKVKKIDMLESLSDEKERKLIVKIFDSDMETGRKLLIKELIIAVGGISDRAERMGNLVMSQASKRPS